MDKAVKLITDEEGFSASMYQDHLGNWTIGHGITNLTEEESMAVVHIRLSHLSDYLTVKYDWFHRLNTTRKAVVLSMVYQLGKTGFSKFKKTIKALSESDWITAGAEAKDSKAYRQTPNRWDRQIELLIEGRLA